MKYNLIFPIAGEGSRFGYTFKPFLEVDNKGNFIELAFSPFKKHLSKIDKILFIFLKAQETKYDVSNKVHPSINCGEILIMDSRIIHTEKNFSETSTRVSLEFRIEPL